MVIRIARASVRAVAYAAAQVAPLLGASQVISTVRGDITGPALGTLRRGGVLIGIGYTAGTKAAIDVTDLIWKTARVEGFLFTAFTQQELADT
ncbi:hypothetical protein [Actinomadura gamaensis]|uniref:Uncharacterized protein n=1 Tax=Actinomadura gamaensis TaxID=1763541 RepID=A0ABV9U4A4_9ACTN